MKPTLENSFAFILLLAIALMLMGGEGCEFRKVELPRI